MTAKRLIGALVGGAVALAALVGGCQHEVDSPQAAATGKVSVSLALAGIPGVEAAQSLGAERTVYPDTSGIEKYVLVFTPTSGGSAKTQEVTSISATVEVTLVVGTYDLTVTAKKGDTEVAEGTAANVVISGDNYASATVTLEPKAGGSGALSYTVTAPAGATGSLTITTPTGGTVTGGTIPLSGQTSYTAIVSLASGEYRLAVSLSLSDKTAKLSNEVVYIYPALTSSFTRGFTDDQFTAAAAPEPEPNENQVGLTIGFGLSEEHVVFYVGDTAYDYETGAITLVQGAGPYQVIVPGGTGWKNPSWSVDGAVPTVENGITLDPEDYAAGTHFLTVTAVKGAKTYSDIVEFTVIAGGGITIGEPVSPNNLAAYVAMIPDSTTADNPHTVKLTTFDVASNTWGTTIYNALNGNTKYITLDLSDCIATGNTISGLDIPRPDYNDFNVIRSSYIVEIIFPVSLTSIGDRACENWTGIRRITLGDNITTIGATAFRYLSNLTSVTIPAGVTFIDSAAFRDSGLTSVTFLGSSAVINSNTSFPNSLKTYYDTQSPKAGTYTWSGSEWSKQ
jgi:hypothetical protein